MRQVFFTAAGAALAWVLAGGAALAGPDCDALRQSFRIPAPDPGVHGIGFRLADCDPEEVAMFKANWNAVAKAESADAPAKEDLYGTWLGDDVLSYVAGVTVPGQEVLRIGPSEVPDRIATTQSWYKAATPNLPSLPWSDPEGYLGIVAEGELVSDVAPGQWAMDPFGARSIRYGAYPLEWERSYDLYVRGELNHFERSLAFRIVGDVLVMEAEVMNPISRETTVKQLTYTRVPDLAPDLALLTGVAMERSQAQTFDCFTHQLGEADSPLLQAMAPLTVDEMLDGVSDYLVLQGKREALVVAGAGSLPADAQAEVDALDAQIAEAGKSPAMRKIVEMQESGSDYGCVPLL